MSTFASTGSEYVYYSLVVTVEYNLLWCQSRSPHSGRHGNSKQFFEGDGAAIGNANIVKCVAKPRIPKHGAEQLCTGIRVQM